MQKRLHARWRDFRADAAIFHRRIREESGPALADTDAQGAAPACGFID